MRHDAIADMRFRRSVERLHRHGPRVLAELLAHIGASRLCMTAIEDAVGRFGSLDPSTIRTLGGDRFPPIPLHEVREHDDRA